MGFLESSFLPFAPLSLSRDSRSCFFGQSESRMGSFLIRDGQIAINKRIRGSIGICLFLLWLPNDAEASLVSSMFWFHNATLDSFAALMYQIASNAPQKTRPFQ